MSYHRDKDRNTRGPGAIASIDNRVRFAKRQRRLQLSDARDSFLAGLTFGERGGVVGGMGAINVAGTVAGMKDVRRPTLQQGGNGGQLIEGGTFNPLNQFQPIVLPPIITQPGTAPPLILPPTPLYVSNATPVNSGLRPLPTKSPDMGAPKPGGQVGVRFPRPRPTVAPGTAGGLLTGNVSSGGGSGGGGGGSSAPPPAVSSPIVPIYDPEPLPDVEASPSSGIPRWVWLLGAGAIGYWLYKKNQKGTP